MSAPGRLDHAEIAKLLKERTGLRVPRSRAAEVEIIVRREMAELGMTYPVEYLEALRAGALSLDPFMDELTVGETFFFRESAHFDFIAGALLAEVTRARGNESVIRVWSAGCASGEEAYSLVMAFAERGARERVHVLATDVCKRALAKARAGVYTEWSLRGEAAARALPFLTKLPNRRYQVNEAICERVEFRYQNLALDSYPSFATGTWGLDVILCRNVLIYFDAETTARVSRRLTASLREGGYLLTGPSDPPLTAHAPLSMSITPAGAIYQHVTRLEAADEPPPSSTPMEAVPSGIATRLARYRSELTSLSPRKSRPSVHRKPRGDRHAGDEARALANRGDIQGALRVAAEAAAEQPLSTDLQYLEASLALYLGDFDVAARALRRLLYLDRTLAVAHFTLGAVLRRKGDIVGARRSYRNARDIAASHPPDAPLPLGEGEPAARLAEAAEAELALLG